LEDVQSRKQVERFVFEVDIDIAGSLAAPRAGARNVAFADNLEELEDAFRQVLLKIAVADSVLQPMKKELTFSIFVHTASSLVESNDNWEALSKEGNSLVGPIQEQTVNTQIVPLKSVKAGPLDLQLYVQNSAV